MCTSQEIGPQFLTVTRVLLHAPSLTHNYRRHNYRRHKIGILAVVFVFPRNRPPTPLCACCRRETSSPVLGALASRSPTGAFTAIDLLCVPVRVPHLPVRRLKVVYPLRDSSAHHVSAHALSVRWRSLLSVIEFKTARLVTSEVAIVLYFQVPGLRHAVTEIFGLVLGIYLVVQTQKRITQTLFRSPNPYVHQRFEDPTFNSSSYPTIQASYTSGISLDSPCYSEVEPSANK